MEELGSPPCNHACPVRTDARGYVRAIARGDYPAAGRLIRERNPFATVCAWVCSHPCEEACRRGQVEAPIAIRYLKGFALEKGRGVGQPQPANPTKSKLRVAVIGSGPAGMTAAHDLAEAGYRVTVFERATTLGGQLSQTIPPYRLDRKGLAQDIADILALGVEARTGVEVGVDVSWEELRRDFAAVLVAVGLCESRRLDLPGGDNENVLGTMSFLREVAMGGRPKLGKRVLVVGGGDVAMDTARTSVRLGAEEVQCVSLEERGQMPAHSWEITEAVEEGVILHPGWGPHRFQLSEDGRLQGLEVKRVRSLYAADGRFAPTFDEDERRFLPAETVILAIGQTADLAFLDGSGIEINDRGQMVVDREKLTTSRTGIFACGELAQGPGAAIRAVAHGQRAALVIRNHLGERMELPAETAAIGPLPNWVRERIPTQARVVMPEVPGEVRRGGWEPFELGLGEAEAMREANRCLRCGLGAEVDAAKCAACLTCLRVCPYGVPLVGAVASMPAEGCQSCNFCAAECPGEAIRVGYWAEGETGASGMGAVARVAGKVAVLACQSALTAVEAWSEAAIQGAVMVSLPNACGVSAEALVEYLVAGATGVVVLACPQCRHPGGEVRLTGVVERARAVLALGGLEDALRLVRGGLPGDEELLRRAVDEVSQAAGDAVAKAAG